MGIDTARPRAGTVANPSVTRIIRSIGMVHTMHVPPELRSCSINSADETPEL